MESPADLETLPLKSYAARYHDIGALGSGSFGSVTLAKTRPQLLNSLVKDMSQCPGTLLFPLSIYYRSPTDLVAIKTMTKQLKRPQDYSKVKEIHFILSVNSHFNLVQIMDIFIDRACLKLHIVMETMDQNLYQLMKSRKNIVFSPRTLKSILTQLLAAILHIHKHLFFHRDVKPENILIMQAQTFYGKSNIPPNQRDHPYIVKLADYGLARHVQNTKPYTAYVSTRWYRSPEILLRQNSYSFPVDIWAFGCVAVECATFIPLFPGSNELDQTDRVIKFLGSPLPLFNGNLSFGGIWDDAIGLGKKLQFRIDTKSSGSCLENVIFRNDFKIQERIDFFDIVKNCLTWDPYKRITAISLCHMNYFKNTIIDTKIQKENFNEIDTNNSNSIVSTKFQKSQLLAGISPSLNRKPKINNLKIVNPMTFGNNHLPMAKLSNVRKTEITQRNNNQPYLTLKNVNDIDDDGDIQIIQQLNNKFFTNKIDQSNSVKIINEKDDDEYDDDGENNDEEEEGEEEDEDEYEYDEYENEEIDNLVRSYDLSNASKSLPLYNEKKFNGQPIIKNRNLIDEIEVALDDELRSKGYQ